MNLNTLVYLIPYLLSASICLAICLYAYRQRRLPGAQPFAFLAAGETAWTIGYILQLISPDLSGKLLWNNLQFLGAIAAPLAYLAFSYNYTGRIMRRSTWRIILILASAVLLLIWTDGLHHLFRVNPHLETGSIFSNLVFTNGPLFILYPFLACILLAVATYILAYNYLSAPRVFRLQIATVLVGVLIPWITTLITWLNLVPVTMHEITPLTFAISNIVLAWALFRYRLFDLVPVAYNVLIENMEDGVIVLDREQRIADLNRVAQQTFNLRLNKVFGKQFSQEIPTLIELIHCLNGGDHECIELSIPVGDDDRIFEARVSKIVDNRRQVTGSLILLHDITEIKRVEGKLHLLATTDPLTSLFNRRYFFEMAEREYERSLRNTLSLAIIIFDIDHFKNVNDTYGHIAGDQVLQSLAGRCLQSLRSYDVMARYGGEEFVILLPEVDAVKAYGVAERLRTVIAETPFETQEGPAEITISLGVASLDNGAAATLDRLIDRADQALMLVKQNGRNQAKVWVEETRVL